MTALISAAQFAELLGIGVVTARQRLWRAGLREQRGYDPAEVAERFGITADKLADLPTVRTGGRAREVRSNPLPADELERLRSMVGGAHMNKDKH